MIKCLIIYIIYIYIYHKPRLLNLQFNLANLGGTTERRFFWAIFDKGSPPQVALRSPGAVPWVAEAMEKRA